MILQFCLVYWRFDILWENLESKVELIATKLFPQIPSNSKFQRNVQSNISFLKQRIYCTNGIRAIWLLSGVSFIRFPLSLFQKALVTKLRFECRFLRMGSHMIIESFLRLELFRTKLAITFKSTYFAICFVCHLYLFSVESLQTSRAIEQKLVHMRFHMCPKTLLSSEPFCA